MSRSHYRWVIVAAGGLLGCVAIGAMFSLPVFLRPISQRTGWSITGVSSAMTFGFLAMAFAPMMACVTGWFDTHRSLAVSLVSAGMGMAPMTMSPFAARLISNHDWRTSLQILAALTAVVMIPVAMNLRRGLGPRSLSPAGFNHPYRAARGSVLYPPRR